MFKFIKKRIKRRRERKLKERLIISGCANKDNVASIAGAILYRKVRRRGFDNPMWGDTGGKPLMRCTPFYPISSNMDGKGLMPIVSQVTQRYRE